MNLENCQHALLSLWGLAAPWITGSTPQPLSEASPCPVSSPDALDSSCWLIILVLSRVSLQLVTSLSKDPRN